ncbi:MAG: YihY/virulence factor BrkB family protein [Rhodoglobus sp.]
MGLIERVTKFVQPIIARVQKLKPVRVFTNYTQLRGPLLSSGLSYQAIFAVFAAIAVAFSIAGSVIRDNRQLQDALFRVLETNVPGLIDNGSNNGAIDPDTLLNSGALTWTGAIAAVILLFSALNWLASGRDAVRAIFGVPPQANVILLKLKDLGLAIGFGAAILLSAVISIASTTALGALFDWLGVDRESMAATVVGRVIGLLLALVLDTLVLAVFYRVLSGLAIPFRQLRTGTIIAAVAFGALKVLGTALLGGATSNPLLASFAVIIGLLIWFNLICQVLLIGASWIAVSARDNGVDLLGKRKAKVTDSPPSGTGKAL